MQRVRMIVQNAVVLSLVFVLSPSGASGQTAKDLVGAWMTVSITSQHGDKQVEPFGPNPKGIQIFDASGRFAIMAMRNDLPKVVSNNRQTQTMEESQTITRGTIAYFGTWTANDADKTLTVNIEGDTFPNFAGTVQKRRFEISGDQLVITNPTGASGGIVTVVLKRAR